MKIEIPKYDRLDDQKDIMWVSKGIFAMNPPANKLEKISMTSLYSEGDAYNWFTWWSKKTRGFSVNWQNVHRRSS